MIGAAAIGMGLNAVGSIAQLIMGAKQASEARKAINDYKRQTLTNAGEGISIATMGAELQTEELIRESASSIGALREGGSRNLIAGLGRVNEFKANKMLEVSAGLEKQEVARDYFKAQEEVRIQQMKNQIENQDLQGLGNMLNTGQQNMFGGISGFAQTAGAAGSMFGQGGMGGSRPVAKGATNYNNTAGTNPFETTGFEQTKF